jgi:hypothetical protein
MNMVVMLQKAEPITLRPNVEPSMHDLFVVKGVMDPALPFLYPLLTALLDLFFNRGIQLGDQLRKGSVAGALSSRKEHRHVWGVLQLTTESASFRRV